MAKRRRPFGLYRNTGYRWRDKDQVCDALRTVIRDEEHLSNHQVQEISGVTAQTVNGWLDGDTRRPTNVATSQVATALGYVRRDNINGKGELEISYAKQRDYGDYRREMEKQANFLLKYGTDKQKAAIKKRLNGRSGSN